MKKNLLFTFAMALLATIQLVGQETYKWENVAIGGGGYVTGLVIHPTEANLMYMRTDIGGIFRWDNVNKRWINLSGWISPDEDNLFGVDGIALDKNNPNVVYAYLGKYAPSNDPGVMGIYKSTDRGDSWNKVYSVPAGGNWVFRWVGEPIQVDPNNSNIIYAGTRRNGLLRSTNGGGSWSTVSSVPYGYTGNSTNPWPGANVSDGNTNNPVGIRSVIIDGSSTVSGKSKNIYIGIYGTGIYRSTDGGSNFSLMSGSPSDVMSMAVAPGNILYVTTLNNNVRKYNGSWSNLAVPTDAWGRFNGIAVDPHNSSRIYVSTCSQDWWMRLYRSYNAGASWEVVYPYAGNATVHDNTWHSGNLGFYQAATAAVVLDPHKAGRLYTTDWYQVWRSEDAWNTQTNCYNDVMGHEEVVPLAICTPHTGVQLFSGHGDVTGFKHTNQSALPAKRLVDKGECTSIDYCESSPANMAIVTASDWYGGNTEIFVSNNSGDNFSAVNKPSGGANGKIAIARNNRDNMVYLYGGSAPYYTTNRGSSWNLSSGAPSGALSTTYMYQWNDPLKADRDANNTFYLMDWASGKLYHSTNGGANWSIKNSTSLPIIDGNVDNCNLSVGFDGMSQYMCVSLEREGLWLSGNKGTSFSKNNYFSNARMSALGKAKSGSSYPTLYVYGVHNNQWGVYRSTDWGANWVRINDNDNYMGNSPTYMGADRQEYGRVYVGNNGSGLFYGAINGNTTDPGNPTNPNDNILIRAKMLYGSGGKIQLRINDATVKTWTLTSSYQDYTYSATLSNSNVKVYFEDNSGDAQIDYVIINGTTLQAESQATNTAVWQNSSCGGSYSELMHCQGYIDFGQHGSGSGGSLVPNWEFNEGTTGWSTWGGGSTIAVVTNASMSGTNAGKVTITTSTSNRWDVGLNVGNISLTNGVPYTISFMAKAAQNKSISVDVLDNGTWKNGFYPTITTSVNTYTFSFTPNSTSSNFQLNFLLGGNTHDFWIDKVVVGSDLKSAAEFNTLTEKEQNSQFKVYPNPATHKINIAIPDNTGAMNVRLLDLLGKQVEGFSTHSSNTEIDLGSYPKGLYLIIMSNEEFYFSEKVVIQ